MQPVLDHIVILVPHDKLINLPAWITDSFTVLNGGVHAGGETANKLIIFRDGTYIELIAFVDGLDPEKRSHHRWGTRPEGHIIDWALTLLDPPAESHEDDPENEFQKVQQRVRDSDVGIQYEDPVAGGRRTPAGTVLKWATSSPFFTTGKDAEDEKFEGGELPFWCLDRTPRPLRVPHLDMENVSHPSKVVGIAGVTVSLNGESLLKRISAVYDAVHGFGSHSQPTGAAKREWEFQAPVASRGEGWTLKLDTIEGSTTENQHQLLVKLTFFTEGEPRKISGTIADGWTIEFDLVHK